MSNDRNKVSAKVLDKVLDTHKKVLDTHKAIKGIDTLQQMRLAC